MRVLCTIPHLTKSFVRFNFGISKRGAVTLSFKAYGTAEDPSLPPFVILHEFLGSKKQWGSAGRTLFNMSKRPVISIDLRNHGFSPHTSTHSYLDLAEDVVYLLNRIEISKAIILGHSMGGKVAMCIGLTAPKKIDKLIVVDVSPLSRSEHLESLYGKILQAMKTFDFTKHYTKSLDITRKSVKKKIRTIIHDEYIVKMVMYNVIVKEDGKIGWACNLDVLSNYFKDVISFPSHLKEKQFHGPTLFLAGENSPLIPPNDKTSIKSMFPKAEVVYISKAGHNPHLDDPKTFYEKVLGFIKMK